MSRELNPGLFASGSAEITSHARREFEFPQPSFASGYAPGFASSSPPVTQTLPYAPVDFPALEARVQAAERSLVQTADRTEILSTKMDELAHAMKERLRDLHQLTTRLDAKIAQVDQVSEQRAERLSAQFGASQKYEENVQDLIDRQNMVIRNFENRLVAMQRVISQQEVALHNSEEALREARHELARLKRV